MPGLAHKLRVSEQGCPPVNGYKPPNLQTFNNFLDLPANESNYETSRFAVLPIPYEATVSYLAGTRRGPAAIIAASEQLELFDEELEGEYHRAGIATLEAPAPNVAGPQAMQQDITRIARRVVRDGKFLLSVGGEHGVTAALVRAVHSRHKPLSVLQIDAHCDLRRTYGGSPHSHACVMRRVLEQGVPIVPVGIRSIALEEHRFMKRAGIKPITARQCHTSDDWIDRALAGLTDTVYVTIDIDGFDPAFAPGTGTPAPGGLDWYQVTGLLRRVASVKTIVAADIVEVMPLPGQAVTEFLAARLAYKLICYVQEPG